MELSINEAINLAGYLFVCLPAWLSLCLSICLSKYNTHGHPYITYPPIPHFPLHHPSHSTLRSEELLLRLRLWRHVGICPFGSSIFDCGCHGGLPSPKAMEGEGLEREFVRTYRHTDIDIHTYTYKYGYIYT